MQDVLSCRDVRQLASHSAADLGVPLHEALRSLPPTASRLCTCKATDTVATAIVRIATSEVS
eukprot:scaffold3936_cov128-Isochrysis_galbana.AAC.2